MPIADTPYKRDELYRPVCGHKYEHKTDFIIGFLPSLLPPVTIPQRLAAKLVNLKTRYIDYECCQCKTKLIYDRKKEIIKIKK